ncbi:CD225/dispanin family protein [uncultured Cellulomonas sp.]|uniref:CD225/dispanin family protein n=1 Tax=uncultured Cellulomonas sp. TaxID=189682 RepID=UPI0028EBE70A|nr:CD225/dispanin family protein [uncultured Cellulomonas sp.]
MATESSPTVPPSVPGPPPGPVTPTPPRPAEPSAPVGWVIAAMILFWPTGIPALLASHRAARAIGAADTDVALRESANARRWGVISVCVGAGLIVLSVLASIAWILLAAVALRDGIDDGGWQRGPGWSHEMPREWDRPGLPEEGGR